MNGSKIETGHMTAKPSSSTEQSSTRSRVNEPALDAILDQTLVRIDRSVFDELAAILDQPASGAGFERLMNAPTLWNEDAPPPHTK